MCNDTSAQLALTVLRIMLGAIFIAHGAQKVLGLFGGPGLTGFVSWAISIGIPTPLAYAAAFAEFIGGLLIFFGCATELGVLMTSAVMIGAIKFVHAGHGFFIQNNGYEYVLSLILIGLVLIIGGPGHFSLCNIRKPVCCKIK